MSNIITDVGEEKLRLAMGSGSQVAISHIALGDASGVAYDPAFEQVALVNERARQPIASRIFQGDGSWVVNAAFPTDTPAFDVYEIGFFDVDGDLIALWAGVDVVPRKTGVIEYLVKHVLNLSKVADGLIVISAPDDEAHSLSVVMATAFAKVLLRNFNQGVKVRDLENQVVRHDREIIENEKKRLRAQAA